MINVDYPQWLGFLLDVYAPRWRHTQQVERDYLGRAMALLNAFGNESEADMLAAVKSYNDNGRFFPKPGELREHLQSGEDFETSGVKMSATDYYRIHLKKQWRTCLECGEKSPNLLTCPFCADLERMAIEFEQGEAT